MIKLGLYSSIANPPRGDNMDRCVQETLAEAELSEACGFHGFFFGEHHQDQDGFLPSPLVVCSAVAARTKKIQIGTSVLLLPLHHPLPIAEDVATLWWAGRPWRGYRLSGRGSPRDGHRKEAPCRSL